MSHSVAFSLRFTVFCKVIFNKVTFFLTPPVFYIYLTVESISRILSVVRPSFSVVFLSFSALFVRRSSVVYLSFIHRLSIVFLSFARSLSVVRPSFVRHLPAICPSFFCRFLCYSLIYVDSMYAITYTPNVGATLVVARNFSLFIFHFSFFTFKGPCGRPHSSFLI